jgi:hypothetical protein
MLGDDKKDPNDAAFFGVLLAGSYLGQNEPRLHALAFFDAFSCVFMPSHFSAFPFASSDERNLG